MSKLKNTVEENDSEMFAKNFLLKRFKEINRNPPGKPDFSTEGDSIEVKSGILRTCQIEDFTNDAGKKYLSVVERRGNKKYHLLFVLVEFDIEEDRGGEIHTIINNEERQRVHVNIKKELPGLR